MSRIPSVESVRRAADMAHALELTKRGEVAAARRIFAQHGVSYAVAEINGGVTVS